MENPFKSIYKFNKDAGLLSKQYSDFLEPSFLIEEALEDLPCLDNLSYELKISMDSIPKEIARRISDLAGGNDAKLTDLQRFDKHIDAIIYAVGGAYKLRLTPQQLEAGIAAVMHSNMQKLKNKKYDEHGKLLKDENFIGPEEALQKILNKRQL